MTLRGLAQPQKVIATMGISTVQQQLRASCSEDAMVVRRRSVSRALGFCGTAFASALLWGCAGLPAHIDLAEISIAKLQSDYAASKYTAVQVTRWHLQRIAQYNPDYNAFTTLFAEQALARAAELDAEAALGKSRGPLWGVPVAVKSSIAIEGEVTHLGWWGYALPGLQSHARANSTVVDRLVGAGAIIVGQTNMPDLGASDTTRSSVAGRTGNAYDPDFSPGGSSGGSATAVAANFVVAALGTDGGNSIRNPASNSSLVGIVPSRGLVSVAGVHTSSWLRERTGPLTRSVADAAIMLDVLAGVDAKDPHTNEGAGHRPATYTAFLRPGALRGRRFGVPKFVIDGTPTSRPDVKYWNRGTSPATRAAFMRTVEELRAAGAEVIFADDILPESFAELVATINVARYLREAVDTYLGDYGPPAYHSTREFEAKVGINYPGMPGPQASAVLETDPEANAQYYEPLRQAMRVYRDTLTRYQLDGFVYPSLQIPSPRERGGLPLPADHPTDGPYSATGWVNKLGVAALVVPAGFYGNGIPYGVEFAGDQWSDGELLGYGYDFEQRAHHRVPPVLRSAPMSDRASRSRPESLRNASAR